VAKKRPPHQARLAHLYRAKQPTLGYQIICHLRIDYRLVAALVLHESICVAFEHVHEVREKIAYRLRAGFIPRIVKSIEISDPARQQLRRAEHRQSLPLLHAS
jgi:hypothetical protein